MDDFASNFESYPIKILEKLIDWVPIDDEKDIISKYVCDLYLHSQVKGRKVIFCHDMKSGYLVDRFLNGSDIKDSFRFFHWSQIDIFIYFSHYLVTIPPLSWINCAHRNGVLILGTFLTEHNDGYDLCDKLFSSFKKSEIAARKLADIMNFYKFDGWLVNIENKVNPDKLIFLIYFLKKLRKFSQDYNINSQVIWYDSLNYLTGNLEWQNELNEKNEIFFNVCDAIYLNYSWNQKNLKNSVKIGIKNKRKYDIYVGVDFFGRGYYKESGFESYLILKKISKYDLSVSLFALGWLHECLKSENYTENAYKMMNLLNLPIRHMPCHLPLITSFCQGFGQSKFKNGVKINDVGWSNPTLQEIQPNHNCGKIYLEDAFDGGGSLIIQDNSSPIIFLDIVFKNLLFLVIIYKNILNDINVKLDVVVDNQVQITEISKNGVKDDKDMLFFINENKIELNLKNNWKIKFFKLETKNNLNNILKKIYINRLTKKSKCTNNLIIGKIYIDNLI